jgi:hypothetical protein
MNLDKFLTMNALFVGGIGALIGEYIALTMQHEGRVDAILTALLYPGIGFGLGYAGTEFINERLRK